MLTPYSKLNGTINKICEIRSGGVSTAEMIAMPMTA
jgi:hypothetical protein